MVPRTFRAGAASVVLPRDCPLLCARAREAKDTAGLAEWFRSKKIGRIVLESECRKAPDWTPLSSELYIGFFRLHTSAPAFAEGKRVYSVSFAPRPRRNLELDEPPCLVEILRTADKLAAAGDLAGALSAYRGLEAKAPGLPALAERISQCHAGLGEFSKAESYMQKALMLAGPVPELYSRLGEICSESGRPGDAAAAFEKAAGLDPENAERWIRLVQALKTLGKPERAKAALEQALALDPRNPEALSLEKEMR